MYYRFKILSCLFVFIVFHCFIVKSAKAVPLVGNIYGSLGGSFTSNHHSGSVLSDIKKDFSKNIGSDKNINLSAGIASNLPLPIINSLRLQFNYIKSLNSSSNNLYGLGLYYDIKTIPIVTPYLGISLFSYNPKIILHNNKNTIKQKVNQGLTSFNVGMSFGFPVIPLAVFAEYNYAIPGIFNNNLNFNKCDVNYNNKDFHLSIITIGIKFYFL